MGGTPPIRGEQDRYTFSGMPIYRDDAASLESHDRSRFRMSDLDYIDDRGIDAGRDKGQHSAILHSENPAEPPQSLQCGGDVAMEQVEIDGSPDNEMLRVQPCPAHVTHSAPNTGGNGQTGQSSSTTEPARRIQMRRIWEFKQRAKQSTMAWRERIPQRRTCRLTKRIVRGVRWIGQCCTCRDEDEDGPNHQPIRQGIRLVEV